LRQKEEGKKLSFSKLLRNGYSSDSAKLMFKQYNKKSNQSESTREVKTR
jgi:hypothetical protein